MLSVRGHTNLGTEPCIEAFGVCRRQVARLRVRLAEEAGALRWRLAEYGFRVVSTPAYQHGIVYVSTSDTRMLQAIDARTGKVLWQEQGTGYAFPFPAVTPHALCEALWSAILMQ
jgi:glucose dehydrogenase